MIETVRWALAAEVGCMALAPFHFVKRIRSRHLGYHGHIQTLSAASFLVAFVVHASVAKPWIRLTRRRGAPVTSRSKSFHELAPANR